MLGKRQTAWITAAMDVETATQAIELARCLSRVVTEADTVVLVTEDVPDDLGELLAKVFDYVISIDLSTKNSKLSKMELLVTQAWNVDLYVKCVVLYPNKLVVKNCDELFDTKEDFLTVKMGKADKQIDVSVMVITPGFKEFRSIKKLAMSDEYCFLSELLNDHFRTRRGELRGTYNFYVPSNSAKKMEVLDVKILSGFENTETEGPRNGFHRKEIWPEIFQKAYNSWKARTSEKGTQEKCAKNKSDKIDSRHYKDSIAIIGHSCRFPGANNIDEFWELIKSGGDGIRSVPVERLSEAQLNDKRYTGSKAGFLKCPIDEFDAKFFGISPREAAFMDPQQRLLAEVAWEALENAAIDPHSLKGSNTGVFTGIWTHDYERLIAENSTAQDFHHIILGNAFSATSARVSYFLGLNGPNVATESGCSSSMVALHLACDSLRKRETNLGLVLGANIIILQLPLGDIPILAKDGHCKTFDESADGFGRAEGVAAIILKRLPDAIKKGDRIMGVIRGTAVSNEGTSSSFGTPSKLCQEIAINDALKNAGVKPEDVDYVEAHGTGTPIGDPIEFAALSAGYTGVRENPLLIGSVKTNIGHTESAAGLAGIMKVILAMENEVIPAHRNFKHLNPSIDLSVVPSIIPLESTPWCKNSERVRIAGVSSFGISGTNVHVVVEEPPTDTIETRFLEFNVLESEKSHHILTLSAKSENALKDLSNKYIQYLSKNPEVNIGDLTHTCNNGRAHLKHRLAVAGKTVNDFQKALERDIQSTPVLIEKPKIAFLFTGQGSQYFGMAKLLFQSSFDFRYAFEECENIIQNIVGISLKNALWDNSYEHLLDQTVYSQLSIFAIEYSLLKVWENMGVIPDVVLGHSVGEFAAAVAAGIINLEDALHLLAERSRLIQSLPPGGMLAIRSPKEKVSQLISEFLSVQSDFWLDIAVINSNEEVVIAGSKNSIEAFGTFCSNKKVKYQALAASHAFHSREMDKIMNCFSKFSSKISYKAPKIPYVSGTTGYFLSNNEVDNGSYWVRHLRESVNFQKGICTLGDIGYNVFVEIGAHPILLALGVSNLNTSGKHLWLPSLRKNKDDWEILLNSFGTLYTNGLNINWDSLDESWPRKKLQLPTYPFQRQKYWADLGGDDSEKIIHPLLGKRVTLADIPYHIYEHNWNLLELQYIKDHQVGHVIVLPGAGFLEIILAAGKNILLKNKEDDLGLLTVKNFVVESPLEMEEGKKYKIQVIASPVENEVNTFYVQVYLFRKLNGYNDDKGWKRYSSAHVTLSESVILPSSGKTTGANNVEKDSETRPESKYLTEDIDTVKNRCGIEKDSKEFYELAPEIGIYFGETFQSIESVWVGENEALALISSPKKAENLADYVYHPIVLDAMIQLFGLSIGKDNMDLYLPVGIDQVFLVNDSVAESLLAHAKWSEEKSQGTVALYSEKNVLLAVMVGIRLMKTSVSSFLNVINAHKNMLPGMYQEIWRQRVGPVQGRINIKKITATENVSEPLFECMEQHMHLFVLECQKKADEGVKCGILKMFKHNGFSPKVDVVYCIEEFLQYNLIHPGHRLFVKRLFEILCEEGYGLEIDNDSGFMDAWKCIKEFPSIEEIEKRIGEIYDFMNIENATVGRTRVSEIIQKCFTHTWDVLIGKKTAVSALFGREDLNPLDVYTKSNECIFANMRAGRYLGLALQEFKSDPKKEDSIVRIIEIGAGSGATTKEILSVLRKQEVPFCYTFTDVSPHFFEGAKEEFSAHSRVHFKVLDIEKDPSTQGFCPHHYDVVVAANVIHATADLKKSVANVRKLIRTGGILVLEEITDSNRTIDVIFGILEGYWKFTDYNVRSRHPMVSPQVWSKILIETGFTEAVNVSSKNESITVLISQAVDLKNSFQFRNRISVGTLNVESHKKEAWLIFCGEADFAIHIRQKLLSICDDVVLIQNSCVEFDNGNQDMLHCDQTSMESLKIMTSELLDKYKVKGLMYLATNIDNENNKLAYKSLLNIFKFTSEVAQHNLQYVIVTKGVYYIQNQWKLCPFNAAVWGMVKSLGNEVSKLQWKLIDLDPDEFDSEVNSQQIFFEAFDNDERLICFRNKKKFVSRMVTLPKTLAPLKLPQGRYTIDIPKSKKINDVSFSSMEKISLGHKDIEVLVKAMALNFRDIFVILKPPMYTTLIETIGTDFAGIISNIGLEVTKFSIGDEVYGVAHSSSVASHSITHEDKIIRKPKELTFTEAATLPSVLLTAFYCMVTVADLKKDETILIHVASGGVGLAAIQIAKQIGAKIIATAGSYRKRNYLHTLGIEHVFHSRDLTFGVEIARVTNGRGVEMVLNSLTGYGFKETTLKACAKNARFIEIGKVNIWKPDQVLELRPDVQYAIVDLEKMTTPEMAVLLHQVECHVKENHKALPYSRYDVVNIRDALNYFLKANHIGKIVVTMPDIVETGIQIIKKDVMFSFNATYLVTGGLGGIGLEVAKWMTDSGCKYLVLVGRSAPTEPVSLVLNSLRATGCKVYSFQVDIGNWDQCKSLFEAISYSEHGLPPLRGVIHSAGVISDAIYMNQTWDKYQMVFNAKIAGCLNLHKLTKDLNLEHFVLFSSMAGLFGPMGQSNHAAANAFLDSFASYRYSIGLPAQTINWGGWAEIGAASNTAYGKEGAFGVKPFTPNQGIASLKFIMSRPDLLQVGVVQIELEEFKQYFSLGSVLSELTENKESTESASGTIQSDKFWADIEPLSNEDKHSYIKAKISAIIRKTLKLPESETIDEFQTFQEMGLDSLMAVEMKNKLQSIIGKNITLNVKAMMDNPTVISLSKYLVEQVVVVEIGENNIQGQVSTIGNEEFNLEGMYELAKKDSILLEEIQAPEKYKKKSKLTNILLTGSTGHLGAYLMGNLAQNEELNISCLLRGKSNEQSRKKLLANLKKHELLEIIDLDKISILTGDITSENFGLSVEEYNKLSTNIGMVIHLAAKANHVEKYQINKGNNMDIRSVNVLGTVNVLKFASNIRTKRVVFSSSFSSINRLTEDGFIYEDFPDDENNADDLTLGYSISKFVCEKLLRQANERGIPCTVIRYSSLLGHSETGLFLSNTNHLINQLLFSLRFGMIANVEGCWFGIPVDVASKLTLELVFNDNVESGVFNIVQPVPMYVKDFIMVANQFGYDLKLVPMNEYEEQIKNNIDSSSFMTIFKDSYGGGGDLSYTEASKTHPKLLEFLETGINRNEISDKCRELIPNINEKIPCPREAFLSYLGFAKRSGILKKFGIGCS